MPTMTYDQVYPIWNPDGFQMSGQRVINTEVCVAALMTARDALRKKGGSCPCCGQHVQVYQRRLYKRMVKCLMWLIPEYQRREGEWIRLKDGPLFHGGDNAKLIYWHLMVRSKEDRSLYKPTEISVGFLRRELSVPKYAYVYNGKVLGFSEEHVDVDEAVENDFDMSDLGIAAWSTYGGS